VNLHSWLLAENYHQQENAAMLRKKIVLGYFKVDTHAPTNSTHTGDLHIIAICNGDLTKYLVYIMGF
jgi:phage antirepressor YoqD-like protein